MKRLLSIVVAYIALAYSPGEAQGGFGPPYSTTFADTGQIPCVGWNPAPVKASAEYFLEGTKHAWVYGFVVGASYMSEERLARIDAISVSDWMDDYCEKHPRARITDGVAALIDHLASRR